jgi:hypothetical protein
MPNKRDSKAIAKKDKKDPVKKDKSKAAPVKAKVAPVKAKAAPKLSKKNNSKEEQKEEVKSPQAKRAKTSSSGKVLDLALLLDCTASMASWIERSKTTLKAIIDNVVASSQGLKVRATFIGYRDFGDQKRFEIQPFTEDIQKVREFISKCSATGGNDMPEDVAGGLKQCLA